MTDFAEETSDSLFNLIQKSKAIKPIRADILRNELLGGPATRKEFKSDSNKSLPRDAKWQIHDPSQHFG